MNDALSTAKVTSLDISRALSEKHSKDFFLTEVKSGSTWLTPAGMMKRLDGLAIRKSWTNTCFTGYEIKISRSDFLRDAKFYTYEELCNFLYIVCPKGLIQRTELPESVGLMYYDPEKRTITTKKKAIFRKIEYSADMLLYIIFSRLDSDRYPFFSTKKEYCQAYVQEKKTSRELGYAVRSRLISENEELIQRIEKLGRFEEAYDKYKAIMRVLDNHNIWGYDAETLSKNLDKRLSNSCPEDISLIRASLETVVDRIKRMERVPEVEK